MGQDTELAMSGGEDAAVTGMSPDRNFSWDRTHNHDILGCELNQLNTSVVTVKELSLILKPFGA